MKCPETYMKDEKLTLPDSHGNLCPVAAVSVIHRCRFVTHAIDPQWHMCECGMEWIKTEHGVEEK